MPRDLEYECGNEILNFDNGSNKGYRCKNYELCGEGLPDWWYGCKGCYLCMGCIMLFERELTFDTREEECPVCLSNEKSQIQQNCGHWMCVSCAKVIYYWDEEKYHISPIPYGCPPCPNGCEQPLRGPSCNCEEFTNENTGVIEIWSREYPQQFTDWNTDEQTSVALGELNSGSAVGTRKCPLCRQAE